MAIEELIYVPELEKDDFWTGRIVCDERSASHWQFEVIRITGDGTNPYSTGVFADASPVAILIDHREKGTLVRPLVEYVEPKLAHLSRTKIKGSFQGLISGTSVEDLDQPLFHSIFFESKAFAAWYGARAVKAVKDENYRTRSVELGEPETETVTIKEFGEITVTTLAHFEEGEDTDRLSNHIRFNVKFDQHKSLAQVMDLCMGLELLFGFLVGFRPPMPAFGMRKPAIEDPAKLANSTLRLGGMFFRDQPTPHPLGRLNMRGRDNASLQTVLEAFISDRQAMMNRIHAVEYSRWFGASLNDQFAAVMPVFEEYVQAKFKTADEQSYVNDAADFWKYVDDAPDENLRNFARKHLSVKDSKAPGLPTLISRAMDGLNEIGFDFQPKLAGRINQRRAHMFHRSPTMSDKSIGDFYEEKLAVTAMLMLYTFRDLGIKLNGIAQNLGALMEHASFTQKWKTREPDRGSFL